MTTILDTLRAINAYPVPAATFERIATLRGLTLEDEITQPLLASTAYRLATADMLRWLADAPNISQGGQNYSFSDQQRARFRNEADAIMDELQQEQSAIRYGYKGTRL